ncbi:hypothetical protein C8A01DRAFT_32452 [Parachaetomium inaequale]|uniref:25S rRNA (uridine-N(3))-methyltransferase BMT5-like domain-containing protein n=1 Tax=Parachaetomium inaequale TaxID=2588326 RepID=A0AAN6SVD4_9PEZI|nr:hypothetical protein C8A01DRAFT_32452 [Parachaetomium inaequale]
MAKGRGRLQHAVKAVKQQQKTPKPTGPPAPASKTTPASKPGTRPGPGPGLPAAKKQKTGTANKPNNGPQQQNQKPTIPFSPADPILLIGEGDLSFAASLITHHHCTNVTATVLEKDFADLSTKYPHVQTNTAVIESPAHPGCRLLYGIDARKLPPFTTTTPPKSKHDPTKTPPTGAMKRIIFNFPHTGGKSTDVNRQVRHNQELLVDFFRRAQPSLCPGGTIVVTLFEGEPYTLWNIRDLARHAGLQVERSFRFVAGVYPGYEHARTLGVVRNRRGEVATKAWRGAERGARSFVFVRRGEAAADVKKRKRGGGSSDEEEEEDEVSEGEGWGDDGEGDGFEEEDRDGSEEDRDGSKEDDHDQNEVGPRDGADNSEGRHGDGDGASEGS